jgi:hypothetical protein
VADRVGVGEAVLVAVVVFVKVGVNVLVGVALAVGVGVRVGVRVEVEGWTVVSVIAGWRVEVGTEEVGFRCENEHARLRVPSIKKSRMYVFKECIR